MNKRTLIIASSIGVLFLFAGYNLYAYFQEQAVIAAQKEQAAEDRRIAREAERRAAEERKAEEKRLAAEREAAERAAEAARREEQRLAEEAQRRAEQEALEKADAARKAERLAKQIERAREVTSIEGYDDMELARIRAISPRFLMEHPEEATKVIRIGPNERRLGGKRRLLKDGSTNFMVFAATTRGTGLLQAALDAGADINAANADGYTALMFAASYNSAEVVRFLIAKGADVDATASKIRMNALHIAAAFNPHPDVVQALVEGGIDIESKIVMGDTPLIAAALENPNLEVVQRLVTLGADKSVYSSEDGRSVQGIVKARLAQGGFRRLTEEMEAEVVEGLK